VGSRAVHGAEDVTAVMLIPASKTLGNASKWPSTLTSSASGVTVPTSPVFIRRYLSLITLQARMSVPIIDEKAFQKDEALSPRPVLLAMAPSR